VNRCKPHNRRDCSTCETGIYARRSIDTNSLADPLSPLHQATYDGAFYGSTASDTSPSSSCETSQASHDSGSSSSSYDSGSSSSYDSSC
jgi:hypothetical protein